MRRFNPTLVGAVQFVMLVLTAIVMTLTVVPGRATRRTGALHPARFAAVIFSAINP